MSVLRLPFGLAVLAALATVAGAQTQPPLAFEAASVKLSPPTGDSYEVSCKGGPGTNDPGLFRCRNLSLTNLMTRAFKLNYDQVSGPDWLRTLFFDIDAKVPPGATVDDFRAMLQNFLATRFGLAVHHEMREMMVYDLVVAKGGPKLKKSASDTAVAPSPPPDQDGYPKLSGRGMAIMNGRGGAFYPNSQLGALTGLLTGQLHHPVTDATGLDGKFDITLYWVTEQLRERSATDPGPSLEQAVQDQLGLRLVAKKGSSDMLVVDHCEKVPTGN